MVVLARNEFLKCLKNKNTTSINWEIDNENVTFVGSR